MKLVKVTWRDAYSVNLGGSWNDIEDLREYVKEGCCYCVNVGWILYEDDKKIVLSAALQQSSDIDDCENAALTMSIPKDWCTEVTELIGKNQSDGEGKTLPQSLCECGNDCHFYDPKYIQM
jgi:hypothetical protein